MRRVPTARSLRSSRPSCMAWSTRRWTGRNQRSERKSQAQVEPLSGACLNGRAGRRFNRRDVMEALPDLATLSDSDLKALIKQLEVEENDISYRRRLLHGKLDILRAELVARLQKKGEGELAHVDVDRVTDILAGKGAPPTEE